MPETRADGIRIHYDDQGRGEPALLFMPGWCSGRTAFRHLAPRCAAHRRILALDWRGHGSSGAAPHDFGFDGLVEDALAVIEASGAARVVPVALSHAGWVALELRRRLGNRLPAVVLLDWIVLEPPPPFVAALEAMQTPDRWREAVEGLFARWLHGVDSPELIRFVREEMGAYGAPMWARAGREILAAYAAAGSPLQALAALTPPVPTLHLYAQPPDPGYLAAQEAFRARHPWFTVEKLDARSHFPMFEVPDAMAAAIERFVAGGTG